MALRLLAALGLSLDPSVLRAAGRPFVFWSEVGTCLEMMLVATGECRPSRAIEDLQGHQFRSYKLRCISTRHPSLHSRAS